MGTPGSKRGQVARSGTCVLGSEGILAGKRWEVPGATSFFKSIFIFNSVKWINGQC